MAGHAKTPFLSPTFFFFGEIARVLTGNRTACVIGGTRTSDCLFLACMGGALNESSSISGRVVDAFHNLDCILPLLMRRGFFFEILILGPCGRGIVYRTVLHHVSI